MVFIKLILMITTVMTMVLVTLVIVSILTTMVMMMVMVDESARSGCHNKIPQMARLKQ